MTMSNNKEVSMKKFIVLSATLAVVFAAGFLFVPAETFAAPVRPIRKTLAIKIVKKVAVSKTKKTVVRPAVRPVVSKPKNKPITRTVLPYFERMQVITPTSNEFINNTFVVSGYAWGWFEGNIPIRVYDYNNALLYDGYITASDNYSAPSYFSKTISLSKNPTTDGGTIEFNDYSAKDGRLVYQKIVPVQFAFSQPKPVITVLYPNGGETYQVGKTVIAKWRVTGNIPSDWDTNSRGIPDVSIALYSGDRLVADLSMRHSGSKTMYFTVPAVPNGSDYRIKVSALGINGVVNRYTDLSDKPFSIITPTYQPTVSVTGSTSLVQGRNYGFEIKITKAKPNAPIYFSLKNPDGTFVHNSYNTGSTTDINGSKTLNLTQYIWQGQVGTYTAWLVIGGQKTNSILFNVKAPSPIPTPVPVPTPTPFSLDFKNTFLSNNAIRSNTNGIGYTYINDARGLAAKFGDSGSFAEYSCSGVFNKNQGTVAALVKFDQFTSHDSVIWQTNDSRFALYYDYASDNSEKRITARAGGEDSAAQFRFDQNYGTTRNSLSAGEWHYIVMTWSGAPQGTVKIYIDGELKDTASYSEAQNCSSFRVGNNYWPGLNFGDGWLDYLGVEPIALSAESIKQIYNSYNLRPAQTQALNVALASNNPVANTILSDSDSNTYPQSQIPFLKVKFTAPANQAVRVSSLRFTRKGFSTGNDIGKLYLVDENNRRLSDVYFDGNDSPFFYSGASEGLFTVQPGTSKIITLMGDLARSNFSVSSGKTIGFDLVSSSNIEAFIGSNNRYAVFGNFPLSGNLMSAFMVSDLGHVYLTNLTSYPQAVLAGVGNQELWQFTANASSQNMEIRSIKLTAVGTIKSSDLRNLRLEVDGMQVGATLSSLDSDRTATFELSRDLASRINKGQSKRFIVKGYVASEAAGKEFKLTIEKQNDIIAYDQAYSMYNPVSIISDTTAWETVNPKVGSGTIVY